MTQCEKCGNTIIEGAAFCTNCGTPAPTNNNSDMAESQMEQPAMQPAMQSDMQPGMQPNMQPTAMPGTQPISNDMQPNNLTSTMPTMPMEAKKEKKKFIPIIAMSAVCVICLVLGIAGIIIGTNSGKSSGGGTGGSSGGGSNPGNVVTPPDTGGDGGGSDSNTTQVQFASYEVSIPNDLQYSAKTNYVDIAPNGEVTWMARIQYSQENTYAQVETSVDNIIASGGAEKNGVTATGSYVEVNGTKYPRLDLYDTGKDEHTVSVIAKAGAYVIVGTIINLDNSQPSENDIETIVKILDSAKQQKELNRSTSGDATDQNLQDAQNKVLQNFAN